MAAILGDEEEEEEEEEDQLQEESMEVDEPFAVSNDLFLCIFSKFYRSPVGAEGRARRIPILRDPIPPLGVARGRRRRWRKRRGRRREIISPLRAFTHE